MAFDADKLCQWRPISQRPPARFVLGGTMFQTGTFETIEPTALPPPVLRAPQGDRLGDLGQMAVKPGWVKVVDFESVFEVTPRHTPKKATQKVLKNLREDHASIKIHKDGSAGQPPKIARISAVARAHPNLH